jgi:hypothetical protein
MRLTADQLADFLAVLEKVESRGEPAPRYPGRLGSYLRQRVRAWRELPESLSKLGLRVRTDGVVSGATLGPIELTGLAPARDVKTSELWGPASHLPILSEELGGVLDLMLWRAGQSAGEIYDLLARSGVGGSVHLDGDYRWTPPARLTAGEATPTAARDPVDWAHARCLKATADDLDRPPHALEYAPDFRLGPPGLKCFRTVCASVSNRSARVLPGLASDQRQALSLTHRPALGRNGESSLVMCLVYREPWSGEWVPVDVRPISAEEVLAHAIEWLDFRHELMGEAEVERGELSRIQDQLRNAGLHLAFPSQLELSRRLLEPARRVVGLLRGFHQQRV